LKITKTNSRTASQLRFASQLGRHGIGDSARCSERYRRVPRCCTRTIPSSDRQASGSGDYTKPERSSHGRIRSQRPVRESHGDTSRRSALRSGRRRDGRCLPQHSRRRRDVHHHRIENQLSTAGPEGKASRKREWFGPPKSWASSNATSLASDGSLSCVPPVPVCRCGDGSPKDTG